MKIKRNLIFFLDKGKDIQIKAEYKKDAKLRLRILWNKNVVSFDVI